MAKRSISLYSTIISANRLSTKLVTSPSKAGDVRLSQFAFERAAHLFEQALELHVDSMTFPPSESAEAIRGEITMALADALAANGLAAQAARILLDVANKDEGADSVSLRQRAAALFLSSGHFDEGLRAAYSALEHHSIEISLFGEHESAAELPGYELSELVSRDVDFTSKATSELKIRFELLWVWRRDFFRPPPSGRCFSPKAHPRGLAAQRAKICRPHARFGSVLKRSAIKRPKRKRSRFPSVHSTLAMS